ncbi:Ltp family lipoprotein [Lactiplantibacillus plantarum]|uniref:Ltp family lipoprotein n=1 Tax=Lactiplantibacillus plantarum TaxID=1590 RepID=UPI001E5F8D67|nr:Ltp family lipoprotein [Lactiplantibacillus plantarum]MCX3292747.1 Ltp family lipoprotein [Lactiplantibacillus plantarum]MDB7782296.1 Ltp family lipoprotein [Lactiplantibacillus plantarum]MDB7783360.1 Ltp family lipoprotein [Lactiplantibacillus plantarum]UZM89265.1 Ltp family lipoprotein [Lactiplantibacillus plantarum]
MLVLGVAMLSLFLVGCSNNSKNNNRTKDTARAEMDVEAIFENKQHKDLIDNTQRSDIDTVKEEVDKLPTSTHKRTLIKEINHAYTLLPRLKKHEKSESISESVKAVQASKKAASIKEAKKEYSRNASNPDAYNGSTPEESSTSTSSATKESSSSSSTATTKVSSEDKAALNKAEAYASRMDMSKQGVYEQLTSSAGEGFSSEAAQYAVNHLTDVDWNANALAKAKDYQSKMSMSHSAILDQLTSSAGEQFTQSQAQYAVDHLPK